MSPAIGLSEFTRAALRTLCTRTCTSIEVHKGGIHMMTKKINVTTTVLLSLLTVVLFQISVKTSAVRAA
jgi:hypothetical protein